MQISSMLSTEEMNSLQKEFCDYFNNGYEFEEFLKEYLIKMGLDEVQVTKKSRDGGVDLTAIRKGVGDFSEIDVTHYYIQAKCNKSDNKIGAPKIRELKGTIPFGHKGMFITTSDFTDDAIKEAVNDPSKPVVVLSGRALIISCIENEIGFLFKPIFSKKQMDLFWKKNSIIDNKIFTANTDFIEKTITANDIRARIVSIPTAIMKQLKDGQTDIEVVVNDKVRYKFSVNKSRNYLGSVTSFLKEYNLLSDDGIVAPKQSKWYYEAEQGIIKIYIGE